MRKRKSGRSLSKRPKRLEDIPFDEALERLIQTSPDELADVIADGVTKDIKTAKKRIDKARKEIEDGARPKKGRFRL